MAPKKRARALKVANLSAATSASVKAALKKAALPGTGGGITAGIVLAASALDARRIDPAGLAKEIAKSVSLATGVRVSASTLKVGDSILVGFVPPRAILKAQ